MVTDKHTSGEWELLEIEITDEPGRLGTFLIKAPSAPGGIAITIGGLGVEEEANARLMVMAPKFLEGIRWLAQTYHQAHCESGTWRECKKNTCDYARQLEALALVGSPFDNIKEV